MKEIWKPVVCYEGFYEVSNLGRIKRIKDYHGTPGILKQQKGSNGYSIVALSKYGIQKSHSVHRYVAEAFIPNPENKRCINHKDNIRDNNIVSNLEWVTHKENNIYTVKQGRHARKISNLNRDLVTGRFI